MDVSGEHQNDVEHSIYKVRLDREGRVVDVTKGEVGDATKGADKALASQDPNYCGSCYGGQPPPSGCCNTCEEVRKSYTDKGWSFTSPESVEQCVREGWTEKLKEQQNEGCNMHGHIEVNKVAGNFHFAPGKSFTQANMHVHDLHSFAASADGDATTVGGGAQFDFSHTVHSLSFGKTMGFSNPLDGTYKKATKGFYMYQYFLKVVGTKFVFLNGTEVNTNQFSATEHERDLGGGKAGGMFGSSGLPGVFFNFDISPLQVIYTEYKKPLSHFLTDVCAIVGGIFTVAGIIDGFVYAAEKTLKKKLELGKAM
ncbi:Endoplasmic reticulum-Golgi intermediate compartment protein 3 [Quaeritorhiza haematococci]|nr:Endoplasmic reticulum-Golgi intermediate compartment protein 3 [Quaeritorhiza haematococci]